MLCPACSINLFHRIGIAIGPRTWFGDRYLRNVSHSGTVLRNHFHGTFGYAIAIASARDFTVENNDVFGNVTFIGTRDPNCTNHDTTSSHGMFVIDRSNVEGLSIQPNFTEISDGDSLTCISPPDGDYWPFRGDGFSAYNGSETTLNLLLSFGLLIVPTAVFVYILKAALKRKPRESEGIRL